jgi:hypothetical protein
MHEFLAHLTQWLRHHLEHERPLLCLRYKCKPSQSQRLSLLCHATNTARASILFRCHLLFGDRHETTLAQIYGFTSNSFANDRQKVCASIYQSLPSSMFCKLAQANHALRFARICASPAAVMDSFTVFICFRKPSPGNPAEWIGLHFHAVEYFVFWTMFHFVSPLLVVFWTRYGSRQKPRLKRQGKALDLVRPSVFVLFFKLAKDEISGPLPLRSCMDD